MHFDEFCSLHLMSRVVHAIKSVRILPAKILSPFLSTAPIHDAPKMLITQATIDCLINNKTKNALQNEALLILNYIGGEPIRHSLSN